MSRGATISRHRETGNVLENTVIVPPEVLSKCKLLIIGVVISIASVVLIDVISTALFERDSPDVGESLSQEVLEWIKENDLSEETGRELHAKGKQKNFIVSILNVSNRF